MPEETVKRVPVPMNIKGITKEYSSVGNLAENAKGKWVTDEDTKIQEVVSELMNEYTVESIRFYEGGNAAAGVRARRAAMQLSRVLNVARKDVQAVKAFRDEKKAVAAPVVEETP